MRKSTVIITIAASLLYSATLNAIPQTVYEKQKGYDITYDGSYLDGESVIQLGEDDAASFKDVVLIGSDIALSLDRPGQYKFVISTPDNGVIYIESPDGKKSPVAVAVSRELPDDYYTSDAYYDAIDSGAEVAASDTVTPRADSLAADPDGYVTNNPLGKLTDEEIFGLRGVKLDYWDAQVAEQIKKINAGRACVTITDETKLGENSAFPPLPENIQCLIIHESSSDGIQDYSYLSRFSHLKYISFELVGGPEIDIGLLKNNKNLRYLSGVFVNNFTNLSALSNFERLRILNISYAENVRDIEFVRNLRDLRQLNLSGTAIQDISPLERVESLELLYINGTRVKDLSPLSNLKKIEVISADKTAVITLPKGELPALKELRLYSTQATDEAVDAFAKSHPGATVSHRWKNSLVKSLGGVDKLVVRDNGTCGPDGKALFEETSAGEITKFISLIDINEKNSGGYDACCGWPTFDFYKGADLVASVSYHHGLSLRWSEWPGDASLTGAGSEALTGWLAAHGVNGPAEELKREREAAAEAEESYNRMIAVIPRNVLDILMDRERDMPYIDAFVQGIPDEAERVKVFLKILGADNKEWNRSDEFLMSIERVLDEDTGAEIISAAIKSLADDPQGLNGAGKLMFFHRKYKDMPAPLLAEILPIISRDALAQPVAFNRWAALDSLAEINNEISIGILRRVMDGEIKPPPPEVDYYKKGDKNVFLSSSGKRVECDTERAYAARLLAETGDSGSFVKIRKMAASAKGNDKVVLDDAVLLIDGK